MRRVLVGRLGPRIAAAPLAWARGAPRCLSWVGQLRRIGPTIVPAGRGSTIASRCVVECAPRAARVPRRDTRRRCHRRFVAALRERLAHYRIAALTQRRRSPPLADMTLTRTV